ncbi:MAG: DUF6011 domain-containing protein [Candidatus Bathyarchaeia archaeon]|jgi:hypothetical protein
MVMAPESSHLSMLLDRVRGEEVSLGYARKESLIDIAEHMLSWNDSAKEEEREAIALLAKYHLATLANKHPKFIKKSWVLIRQELAKPYEARCCRCGAVITAKKSLETGLGSVCRKKVISGLK